MPMLMNTEVLWCKRTMYILKTITLLSVLCNLCNCVDGEVEYKLYKRGKFGVNWDIAYYDCLSRKMKLAMPKDSKGMKGSKIFY